MNDLQLNHRIYKEYGETMRYVQQYESLVLSLVITVKYLNSYPKEPEIKEYEKALSKRELGKLIGFLKKNLDFNEEIQNSFKNYIIKRIYLAHHFFTKNEINTLNLSEKKKNIK